MSVSWSWFVGSRLVIESIQHPVYPNKPLLTRTSTPDPPTAHPSDLLAQGVAAPASVAGASMLLLAAPTYWLLIGWCALVCDAVGVCVICPATPTAIQSPIDPNQPANTWKQKNQPNRPSRLGWRHGVPAAQIGLQLLAVTVLGVWRFGRDSWMTKHDPDRATWAGWTVESLRGLPTYASFAIPVRGGGGWLVLTARTANDGCRPRTPFLKPCTKIHLHRLP